MTFWLTRRDAEFINIAKDYDTISASCLFSSVYTRPFLVRLHFEIVREMKAKPVQCDQLAIPIYIDKILLIIRNLF